MDTSDGNSLKEADPSSDWIAQLSNAVASALKEFAPQLPGERIVLLAVDCHPWNGTITLSALTSAELAADEMLDDLGEMAAWRYYAFTEGLVSWRPVTNLGREMRDSYELGNRPEVAPKFLRGCALAMMSSAVATSLKEWPLTERFRVSVPHPDTGQELMLLAQSV